MIGDYIEVDLARKTHELQLRMLRERGRRKLIDHDVPNVTPMEWQRASTRQQRRRLERMGAGARQAHRERQIYEQRFGKMSRAVSRLPKDMQNLFFSINPRG